MFLHIADLFFCQYEDFNYTSQQDQRGDYSFFMYDKGAREGNGEIFYVIKNESFMSLFVCFL